MHWETLGSTVHSFAYFPLMLSQMVWINVFTSVLYAQCVTVFAHHLNSDIIAVAVALRSHIRRDEDALILVQLVEPTHT